MLLLWLMLLLVVVGGFLLAFCFAAVDDFFPWWPKNAFEHVHASFSRLVIQRKLWGCCAYRYAMNILPPITNTCSSFCIIYSSTSSHLDRKEFTSTIIMLQRKLPSFSPAVSFYHQIDCGNLEEGEEY